MQEEGLLPHPGDVHISYLPLAHMLERVVHVRCVMTTQYDVIMMSHDVIYMQCFIFMCGAKIGFFGGDIKLLVNDIQTLRPTIFISVPRLLNRIYDKVSECVCVCCVCVCVRVCMCACVCVCE